MARRSFLSRFGLGLTASGATLAQGAAGAQTLQTDGGGWRPAHHATDNWLDELPGKHRFVFDTTSPEGVRLALIFVNNYFTANQTGYGLKDNDLAVVIVVRHLSTPFAYNDAIWGKYGVAITQRTKFNDPTTNQPPKINIYNSTSGDPSQGGRGTTLNSLVARGVHLAVCQISTRTYSGTIATATGGKADAIYDEIVTNLVGRNAHIVPAGIVAVNRAQERGYSFVFAA
jgi:hypothetical protein